MLEFKIVADKIVPPQKNTFPEPTSKDFETFLNDIIGYNGEFKAKEFKNYVDPGLCIVLMHLIL